MARAKTCKVCKEPFTPVRPIQPTCGKFACGMEYALAVVARNKANKARKEAIAHREAKVKARTLTEWLDDAQDWVNRYIRLRDANDPCISCGTTNPNIQYAAGHYRTRKAASHLRFNHDNLHKQCNHRCNKQLSGNIAGYRPALIQKIGIERVEAIENDNSIHRWTIDEAKAVIAYHKQLIKELINDGTSGPGWTADIRPAATPSPYHGELRGE